MSTNTPEAACALIVRPDHKVLCVSRRDDPNAHGLPGGGREPFDATLLDTALRELWEETRIRGEKAGAIKLHDAPCADLKKGTVTRSVTFYIPAWSGLPRSVEEGRVSWRPWEDIVFGPFGEYNADVAKRYREMLLWSK
jgi:8-oxo-dGTP pyrophosphatase MutT (NUDIX family)